MLLQRGRWEQFKHYWCVQLFSAVSSLIVCCSARACEGSCSQHAILWLLAALPASQALRARVQRAPLTKQAESFLDLVFFFFYWKIITWNPDQVSVVMLKKPQWHQSLLLLHQTICLKHQSFKSSAHQHDKTFPAEWQESSVYSTVLYSCNHEQLFPEFQRIQKLKQEQGKLPWTLVSTAFQNDHEWDL